MRERGSALMLMPAAVLAFLVLGALAVDFGGAYAAERELSNAAAAAANDAATRAIDLPHQYATGAIRLDEDLAAEVARASVLAKGRDRFEPVVRTRVEGLTVVVTVEGRSPYLFAKALPSGDDAADVAATSRAEAVQDP